MGKTIIEKIVAAHTKDKCEPGDTIWLDIDVRTARDFGGASVVEQLRANVKDAPVADAASTFFTFDCNAPANTIGYANNQMACRKFAWENGLRVYDVDRGIGSHVVIEEGIALPGVTLVGTDSHLNLLGAVGCLGLGMGDTDVAYAFATGRTWFLVPPTVKIRVEGELPAGCTAKDLTLKVVGQLKSSGLLGVAAEYYGAAVDALDLAGRITLASMTTEMGGVIAFIPPNDAVLSHFEARLGERPEPVAADADAAYSSEIVVDLNGMEPMLAMPGSPDGVKPISEVEQRDVAVNSVFIGSCTNGRIEDMRAAADVLKERGVKAGVMAMIVPATRGVFGQMLDEGLVSAFHKAGAVVSNPGCGGCASGQIGMTGVGEVQVSTSNRNFRGKQGAGSTYLASPVTAALAAAFGKITRGGQ